VQSDSTTIDLSTSMTDSSYATDISMKQAEIDEFARRARLRTIVSGTAYIFSMSMCGIILATLGITLVALAENVGRSATSLGALFISRGIGAVSGSVGSAKLYQHIKGNYVMAASLAILMLTLLYIPWNTSLINLHISFFVFGLGTAITDTGCQILTRRLHRDRAGPCKNRQLRL
jgi:predicted MFS family arabinose efflux permease